MSILKHTSFQILSAQMAGQRDRTFKRTAHKADFDHVERRPGYLYVRSRAISSRINENFDGFSAEEIKKGYETFMGKPVFVSHHNSNHRRARGAIVAVALHEDFLADKTPDTWVEVLMEVDAVNFPKLAQGILAGEIARTSMGCDVAYSSCTFCGNKAYTEAEYCSHIPRLKGKRIERRTAAGGTESVLVAEQCFGLAFFENSLLVEEPADPTAFVLGIDGIGVTARKTAGWTPDELGSATDASKTSAQTQVGEWIEDGNFGREGEVIRVNGNDLTVQWSDGETSVIHENEHGGVYASKTTSRKIAYEDFPQVECKECGHVGPTDKTHPYCTECLGLYVVPHTETHTTVPAAGAAPVEVISSRYKCRDCGHWSAAHSGPKTGGVPWCGECEQGNAHEFVPGKETTAGNDSDLAGAEDKVRSIIEKLKPRTEYGPDYDRSIASHLSEAQMWLGRNNIEGALRHAYLAETVAGNMDWDDFKAWDDGPTQLSFGGKRIARLHKRAGGEWRAVSIPIGNGHSTLTVTGPGDYSSGQSGTRVAKATHLVIRVGSDGAPYWTIHGSPEAAQKARDQAAAKYTEVHLVPVEHTGSKHAINEIIAPPEVDTLRESECPICGSDAYNGEECPVCLFIKPPDMFMDPDLDAAQNADLRSDVDQANLSGSEQVMENQDQTPVGGILENVSGATLECDSCGSTLNGLPEGQTGNTPATPAASGVPGTPDASTPPTTTPAQPTTQPGAEPPPPANDESMPLPLGDADKDKVPPAGKELPKPKDGKNDEGQDDGSKEHPDASADTGQKDMGKVETDIDAGGQDGTKKEQEDQAVDTLQSDLKAGDPCPVCDGQGTLQPKADDKPAGEAVDDAQGSDDDDDSDKKSDDKDKDDKDKDDDDKKSDGPPWLKDKNSSKGVKSSISERRQGVSRMAQPTFKVLAAQQAELRRNRAEIAQLKRSVNYIARLAGIVTADVANPGNPIPQPAGQGAPSSTEQARTPAARVNVQDLGATPVAGVAADATDTVDTIGGVKADTPYSINQEVTVPVAGTETRRPVDEVRTLPEIEFGNPMAPDQAFPLQGEFAEKATLGSKGRTYAALRLARLRRAAGIETSNRDELVVANAIDANASLSDAALAAEIDTLSKVVAVRKAPAAPRRQAARRLVPQSTNVERTVPSVAVGEGLPQFTSASSSDDDAFAFCE